MNLFLSPHSKDNKLIDDNGKDLLDTLGCTEIHVWSSTDCMTQVQMNLFFGERVQVKTDYINYTVGLHDNVKGLIIDKGPTEPDEIIYLPGFEEK